MKEAFKSKNFEAGMEQLWANYSAAIPSLMRHMALYFAQFGPAADTNLYRRLIRALKRKELLSSTALASLNYDLVLELSASAEGVSVDYFSDPFKQEVATVWKLHGSCNFLPSGIQATSGVTFTGGVVFNTGLQPGNPNDAVSFCLGDTSLYPSMCLYLPGKHVQIGASALKAIQDRWKAAVLGATQVLIIGVAPNYEDTHIWQPLGATPAEIAYVGDCSQFKTWAATYRSGSGTSTFLGERWEDAFLATVEFIR
ncbi:MAG: hypothetical protein Q8P50_02760 [Bacillota bacterium]|nr:hypothetical protein [Bacillota bacterium]